MKKKSKLFSSVLVLASTLLFAACGNSDPASESGTADSSVAASSSAAQEKTKITIATSGAPKPFSFQNEENELEGYDIEVVKAVFEELPQYEIDFQVTEFPSVLTGLDSDLYQVGANNFASNDERREKYLYSDAIFKNQYVIAVAEANTDINSFADLAGKSTEVSPGVNYTTALENYNNNNPDAQVELNYAETEIISILQNVESGKYDFQLIDAAMLNNYVEEHGLKIKAITLTEEESDLIGTPYSYLLVSKTDDGEKLVEEINAALATIIENNTVSEISEKYFGGDFAPEIGQE